VDDTLQERSFSVTNERGDPVDCDVRFVEDSPAKPVVIFCHGFKGFKDWGPFPEWGRHLARSGFISVHLNFSYNGVHRDAPTEFTELEKFAQNTFTRELDDLRVVLDAVADGTLPTGDVMPSKTGLLGHSRGGAIVIIQAARDERVEALATWSSVAALVDRFTEDQIEDWHTKGYTEVLNSRTGQVMRLNKTLYDDALAHQDELDVLAAAQQIDKPWFVVHAPDDESVDVRAARTLVEATDSATLVKASGGHTFGGAHPFDGSIPSSLRSVWDRTTDFFQDELPS